MAKQWWKEGVVYQIYPRSFKDSNGDGIGDIKGVIEKVDYLKELGVDIVWLNPVYNSPNDDNGYDISDYRSILTEFGNIDDWKVLISKLHDLGIRLIMDLVVNHTSDEHPWFVESKKSKDNLYRDYYIWQKELNGKEPNNWESIFSGSAWKYDEGTDEYFLHLFSKKQPDLNWENETVRNEVYEIMKWWLDKGIDGFRMDVINFISKVPGLPSVQTDKEGYVSGGKYYINGPRVHEFLREMNREVLCKYDVMTVGETPGVTPEDGLLFTGEDRCELSMIFQFEHMGIDNEGEKWNIKPWKLTDLKRIFSKWQVNFHNKGWNSLFLNNHDQPRMVSRFGNDKEYRVESAKLLATMLHTLHGTPYIYQGEEIGMTNVKFHSINDYKDVEILNYYEEWKKAGKTLQELLPKIHYMGRDNARTPMHWDDSENAGFTTGTPWIKMNPNYKEINVGKALEDKNSVFYYYKELIKLRKENPVIIYGDYKLLYEEDEKIYSYIRSYEGTRLLVILNFSKEEEEYTIPEQIDSSKVEVLIANYEVEASLSNKINLKPYEARVYKLK
ncbi:glycoside hydrolase family 13 protein [Clostridium sp. DL1XJH146]